MSERPSEVNPPDPPLVDSNQLNSDLLDGAGLDNDDRGWLDDIEPEIKPGTVLERGSAEFPSKRQGIDPKNPIVLVETAF